MACVKTPPVAEDLEGIRGTRCPLTSHRRATSSVITLLGEFDLRLLRTYFTKGSSGYKCCSVLDHGYARAGLVIRSSQKRVRGESKLGTEIL